MANRRPVLPEYPEELLELIEKGKLFTLQDWIKAGKRLRAPEDADCDAVALRAAVTTGLIEPRGTRRPCDARHATRKAVRRARGGPNAADCCAKRFQGLSPCSQASESYDSVIPWKREPS